MSTLTRRALGLIVVIGLAVPPLVARQMPAAATAALTDRVPLDPAIATGTFANGLRYYIRGNRQPADRAELRLVVNAGSILEDDDQQGLAHMVEHMAFNGTAHFPKSDVITFMQSIGMRFGADVNAYTSFDETVYELTIPTDKPEVMDKALTILEDWAHAVTFDQAEIDRERGVVMEEWRLGRGAGARIQDKQFPVILEGSRYATRLPIGKPDIIQNFTRDRLTTFYHDWYRPDLMAVVVVGDFDPTAVRTLVTSHFQSLPAPATPTKRPVYSVPDRPGTRYTIATDKEMTGTGLTVYRMLPPRDSTTIGAYRQEIVERLFSNAMSARFVEIAQQPNAPFLGAGGGRGLFVREKESAQISASVKDDGVERGLDALFVETARIGRFGFTQSEIDRQKTALLRSLSQAAAEKDKVPSGSLAAEYIRHFLQREPSPGIAYEDAWYQRFVPGITLAEVNVLAKDWAVDDNRVVAVRGPEKPGVTLPDATRLAAIIEAAPKKDITPYVDSAASATLIDAPPTAGTIAKTTMTETMGVTTWTLSNGVRVVLKPTTFKADEIQFQAFAPGGHSLASDADFVPASTATSVISTGGLGKLPVPELRKVMTGKVAQAVPYISELESGLRGSASRQDLETLFQLIYLDFTAPRADPTMFGVMQTQAKAQLANATASPSFAFAAARNEALFGNHPRRQLTTSDTVDRMNLDTSMAFYRDRFADASNFTFIFVGNVDLAAMRPLAERYLASLPAAGRHEAWKDVGVHYATGVVERRVDKGLDPKSQVAITFSGPFVYDQAHRVAIRAMADVLQTRLTEVIREELGGTYGIGVGPGYTKIPREEYTLTISFGCDPARTDALVKRVFEEIAALQATGPSAKQLADEKTTLERDLEGNLTQNGYWLGQIYGALDTGEDMAAMLHLSAAYAALDGATIQQAATAYFNMHNYVKVTLFPEKPGGAR